MTRHRSRTAAVLAGMAILMLLAAPAVAHHKQGHEGGPPGKEGGNSSHPSGKDRSTENGRSGAQGKSPSAPDQDGRGPDRDEGGTDKPGGSGGADPTDQDGNNGCGNDTDFDDDNEGLCGGPGQRRSGGAASPARGEREGEVPGGLVQGEETPSGDDEAPNVDNDVPAGTRVLGLLVNNAGGAGTGEAGAAGGDTELASTGLEASRLALASVLLLALGIALVLLTRRRDVGGGTEN